jgi:hypothetical protein
MGNTSKHLLAAVLAVAALPAAARAQSPGANDPEAGSPSGAIYEIPLDTARGDAAPRSGGSGDAAPPAGGTGAPDSPIRSENGFGSSSQVPGATVDASTTADSRSSPEGGQRPDRTNAPAGRRSDGGVAAEALIASRGTVPEEPSGTRAYLLLALAVVVAVGLGVAARRATR